MLLRNRPPGIDSDPLTASDGLEHLEPTSLAVIRWLGANRVDCVLVGAVARSIRGDAAATGPVAIVAAPYGRNIDRLARALAGAHARVRRGAGDGGAELQPQTTRLTAAKLLRVERWELRCGRHDLDLEGHPAGAPRYQELLYEATRWEVSAGVSIEVAAPADIEYYDHVGRTGTPPEIRVTRAVHDAGHA